MRWSSPFQDNNCQVQELMLYRHVVVGQPLYMQVGDVWMHQHVLLHMFRAQAGLRRRVEIHELVLPYCMQANRHQLFLIRGTHLALWMHMQLLIIIVDNELYYFGSHKKWKYPTTTIVNFWNIQHYYLVKNLYFHKF